MRPRSLFPVRLALWGGLLVAAWLLVARQEPRPISAEEVKAVPAFDRVPTDTHFFLHVRVGDAIKSAVGREILTGLGKQVEPMLKKFQDEFGFALTDIDQFTLWQPKLVGDGGQQVGFLFQMAKPYDADALRKAWADPNAKADPKSATVVARNSNVVHLTDADTFGIMHKELAKNYLQPKETKDRPLENALKLAREKHALVVGVNFASLPAEVLDEGNVFLRPFIPLLKDNRGLLVVDVDKEIRGRVEVDCKSADAATDALRSWNLLMRLASDSIDSLLKDDKNPETVIAAPFLKEIQNTIGNSKAVTEGAKLRVSATAKGDLPYSKLVGEIIKSIYGVSEAAQDAQSSNNLKQLGIALHNYHDTHGGFPPQAICDKKGKPLLSWRVALLPYIEQDAVYKQFKLDEPWDSEHNLKLATIKIKTYMLPGDKPEELTKTPYRCFFGNGAAFDRLKMTKITDFTDGTSNTVLVVESSESVVWTKPDDLEFNPKKDLKGLLRESRERFTLLFADGSVRRTAKSLPEATLKLLIQRNDGMPIPNLE